MKIISLNTYAGHFFEPLLDFITSEAPTTDIFCFQEILSTTGPAGESHGARTNLLEELITALPGFQHFFAPSQANFDVETMVPLPIEQGVALFVKKTWPIHGSGNFFIYHERNSYMADDIITLPHNSAYVRTELKGMPLTVFSVHGTAYPFSKLDTPDRLAQSEKIIRTAEQFSGDKVIMGDFNLLPDTVSVTAFEKAGFRNLVKEWAIKTTRGSLLKQIHPEYAAGENGFQEFADYAFVTPGLTVKNFTVPDLPISDHLPLILTIN